MGAVAVAAVEALPAAARPSHPASPASLGHGGPGHARLARDLHADLTGYLGLYAKREHVSAAALSVSLPGSRSTLDVSAGTTTFGGTRPVTPSSVWQIGSNTKAFTSILLLKLEAQHKLSIHDTLGRWLPQYPQWRHVTISSLLHMTSGIPSYEDQPAFGAAVAADPHRVFSKTQLVSFVTGLPLMTGYHYSNTGYILAEMIIEKVARVSYQHQLYTQIIRPLGLRDLFYRPDFYPPQVTAREPAGYLFAHTGPALARFIGHDVSRFSMSYTRGAGGIIATTHEMTVWERAMYSGAVLPARQQAELTSLVSTATGKPIKRTSPDDPGGFGLGLTQGFTPEFGNFWFYEGGTMGFRTIHLYVPKWNLILALGLNSYTDPNTPAAKTDPNAKTDHISDLALAVIETLAKDGALPA